MDFTGLNDDTLNALHQVLAERGASRNGDGGELMGIALSQEWQRRYPGTLPPHLANKIKPSCYRGPGADPAHDPSGQAATQTPRSLNAIAREISDNWGAQKNGIHYTALPYVQAMLGVAKLSDSYGQDSAESIVRYFLNNAKSWRGDVAKRVKAELNNMLKVNR